MAVVNTLVTDNFEQWRQKTNTIGSNLGDLSLLTTTDKTTAVNAINEVSAAATSLSLALSIALG